MRREKIKKSIDLSNIPTKGKLFDWSKSEGSVVKFTYDDIDGEIIILKYLGSCKIKIEYNKKEYDISTATLSDCSLGGVTGKVSSEFKYEIGDTLNDKKRSLNIIDREYRRREYTDNDGYECVQKEKWYKYVCLKCDNEQWIIEQSLKSQGVGCNVCGKAPKKVDPYVNSLYAVHPWVIDLGINLEEAKRYTSKSGDKIKAICPHCGKTRYISVNKLVNRKSIGCTCGDGFSYGHKYIYKLLEQLNLEFEEEVKFEWCKFYSKYKNKESFGIYDFVIRDKKIIIEVDGNFHRITNSMTGQTKEESMWIDEQKDKLARDNGYSIIRILYDDQTLTIDKYILESEINNIFDLSQIDWNKCEEFSIKSNKVKEVCNYWNKKEEWETTNHISKIVGLSETNLRNYLKKGTKLGWCNYDSKEEVRKNAVRCNEQKQIPIKITDSNGCSLGVYNHAGDIAVVSEELFGILLTANGIRRVARGERKQYKGFKFEYVKE